MNGRTLLLGYCAMGIVGWIIGRALSPDPLPETTPEPPPKLTRPDPRPPATPAAAHLLGQLRATVEAAKTVAAQSKADEFDQQGRKITELREFYRTLPTSKDPASAFHAALAELPDAGENHQSHLETAALYAQWATRDPKAAVAFKVWKTNLDYRHEAQELAGELIPLPTLLPLLKPSSAHDPLFSGCVRPLIASLDTDGWIAMLGTMPDELTDSFRFHLRMEWPRERRADFDALAVALGSDEMFASFSDDWSKDEAAEWLIDATRRLGDSDFGRRMRSSKHYWDAILAATHLPLDTLLAALPEDGGDSTGRQASWIRSTIAERHAERTIGDFLRGVNGPDHLFAFRHGRLSAAGLLDLLREQFPGDREAAELTPEAVHAWLAVEDPVAAAALLEDLPARERALAISAAIDYRFNHLPLSRVESALRTIPRVEDGQVAAARAKIWDTLRDGGVETYGQSYLEWAASLPDPRDSEMLTDSIVHRLGHSYPTKGVEIRRLIGGDIPLPLRP